MKQKEYIRVSLHDDGYAFDILKPIKEEIDIYLGNQEFVIDSYEFPSFTSVLIYPSGLSEDKVKVIRKSFEDIYLK